MLKMVGEAEEIKEISFNSISQLRQLVPETPSSNYMWVFYGSLRVEKKGTYSFCTTSDDGSRIILDGLLLVDNDGIHGAVKRCAEREMEEGSHSVDVEEFKVASAGLYQTIHYSGPDTGNTLLLMPIVGDKAGEPLPLPTPSSWTLRMYHSHTPLAHLPNLAFCTYIDEFRCHLST